MYRRTEDGAHLGAEHDRFGKAQADAYHAQRGVEAAVGRAVFPEPARVFVHPKSTVRSVTLLPFIF